MFARQAADVDDESAAGLLHQRNGLVAAVEDAAEVRGDRFVPRGGVEFADRGKTADAGVVDEVVEVLLRLADVAEEVGDVVEASDIADPSLNAAERAEIGHRLIDGFGATPADNDGRALAEQCPCDGRSDTLGAAGDNGDATFQFRAHGFGSASSRRRFGVGER